MVNISAETSRRVSMLSLLGACLVVFLHSYSTPLAVSMSGSFAWWVQDIVSQGVARVAVPYFLVVFGFMLFKDFKTEGVLSWWRKKIRTRVRSLLLPYFAWSIIGTLVIFVMTRFAAHQVDWFSFGSIRWWLAALGITAIPTFMFHLWFVRTIMIFVACAPVMGLLFVKFPASGLLATFLCAVFGAGGSWASSVFYAGIGIVLATQSGRVRQCLERRALQCASIGIWILLVAVKVGLTRLGMCDHLGRMSVMSGDVDLMVIVNLFGLLAYWNIGMFLMRRQSVVAILSRYAHFSFFIYCAHWIFLGKLGWVFARMIMPKCSIVGMECLNWFCPPFLALAIAIFLGVLSSKCLPRFYRVLSGGR